jgi:hypothetical protein
MSEMIGLRGGDLDQREEVLIIRNKVKGDDYISREVRDRRACEALYDHLECYGRGVVGQAKFVESLFGIAA